MTCFSRIDGGEFRLKGVLEYIISFQQEHRMAPTVREICAHLGLGGPAGIHRILNICMYWRATA